MLLEPERADEVAELIRAEDFYRPANRMIYAAICELRSKGREIDPVLVGETIDGKGQLDEIGGYEYLHEAFEAVPHGAHARHYATIVREKSLLRQAQFACSDCIRECSIPGAEVEAIVGQTEGRLHTIIERRTGAVVTDIKTLLMDAMDAMNSGRSFGLRTGFDRLDKLLFGWQPGTLCVLAGRPGCGKTALAIRCLLDVAKQGAPGVFFSLEQSRLEVSERVLAMESGVALSCMKQTSRSDEINERLMMNAAIVSEWPVHVDDRPGQSLQAIMSIARLQQRRHGIRFVLIDYLQLIEAADRSIPREQQVAEISKGLKRLARQLEVPVIVLAQMNRQVMARADKRPQLSDLRESGAIEQDADVVMFLDRPWIHDPEQDASRATLIIAKHRNGECGDVPLQFEGPTMRFREGTLEGEYLGDFP